MKDYHKILFPYAYNILGSSDDAKDAIQDVLVNYVTLPKDTIQNEKAFLVKSVINRAITMRTRSRKFTHEDVWLPEPIATEQADTNTNLNDILSYSMLILMEQLSAKERAVFILKEAFDYSHQEISEVLSSTVEHSRKLLSRARNKIKPNEHPHLNAADKSSANLLDNFIGTIRNRDIAGLESLITKDIAFYADGGKTLNVTKKLCIGANAVADLLLYIYHTYQAGLTIIPSEINHQPALLYYDNDKLINCQVFELTNDNSISQISNILDPKKIKGIKTL